MTKKDALRIIRIYIVYYGKIFDKSIHTKFKLDLTYPCKLDLPLQFRSYVRPFMRLCSDTRISIEFSQEMTSGGFASSSQIPDNLSQARTSKPTDLTRIYFLLARRRSEDHEPITIEILSTKPTLPSTGRKKKLSVFLLNYCSLKFDVC